VAGHAIPRGGVLTVDLVGEGESLGFRIEACGLNSRVPRAMAVLVAGGEEGQTIDAHAIQPFYTGLLAKTCGLAVSIEDQGEAVIIAAR
jgi:histidine phosphotransferase ChpT